jgi:hypothetical protein
MSDREFSYFQETEKACASYNQTKIQEETKKDNVKKATDTYVTVVLVSLAAAFILPFLIFL